MAIVGATTLGTVATAAAEATAVAAAAYSGITAYNTAKAEEEYQEEYNEMVVDDMVRQYNELDSVAVDAIYESHAESLQAQKEAMKARSTINLYAAATGTYGNSVSVALADVNSGLGQRLGAINHDADVKMNNLDTQAASIKASAEGNQDTTVSMPAYYSAFTTGLSTFGAVNSITGSVGNAYSQL
jgi:hypothetical protein